MVKLKIKLTKIMAIVTLFYCILLMGINNIYANELLNVEFLLENDRVLDGSYEEETLYFQVKEYWDIQNIELKINLELSSMLLDIPASLTFKLNGVPISSHNLDYTDGQYQEIYVNIPVSQLDSDFNSLSVTGFAQIYGGDGCIDEFSGANWVVLDKSSGLNIEYKMKEPSYIISEYPYQLLYNSGENGKGVSVVVPDNASADELTAATWIKSGLAQDLQTSDSIKMEYYSNYDYDEDSAVIVMLYENMTDEQKEIMEDYEITEEDIESSSVIIVDETDQGTTQILITSKKGSCLSEAAEFLMDESRRTQEDEPFIIIGEGSADLLKEGIADETSTKFMVSEWSGYDSGIEVRGSFRRDYTLYPPEDITYVLGKEDIIFTNFRYSENLDFKRSLFTVYVNGEPIGSKKLEKDYSEGNELELFIPDTMAGEILESITFAFDLEIADMYCTMTLDEMPWGFISGDSYISLSGIQDSILSIDSMPWPFVKNGYADNMVFVIPDEPSDVELEILGSVAGMYGRSMKPYGNMDVLHYSETKNDNMADAQIIWIGTFENKSMMNKVADKLPFAIDTDNNRFLGNKTFAFSDNYSTSVATMQMIPSIYNESNVMLVVTSPTDETLLYLDEYLEDIENQESLQGDTVLVDSNLEMRYFKFQDLVGQDITPSLRERLEENKESVAFALTATSVMSLLLIAAIIIFIRVRRVNRRGGN